MCRRRLRPSSSLLALLSVLAAVVPLAAVQPPAAATDPTRSPRTVLSADGRSGTDGVRTLAVSRVSGLSPDGHSVRVMGSGYDTNKGVYVALCVIPPPNVLPTPCGGGVDIEGQAGASQWISSNPPSYGVGLARPYGPGGTFDTTFSVRALINASVDCRQVRCAILTRNDHMRSADRSQDILVPVTFAVPAGTNPPVPSPTPAAPQPTAPQPATPEPSAPFPPPEPGGPGDTLPPTTTTTTPPAPSTTIAEDGRSVTDGTRTLRIQRSEGIDASGEVVRVAGEGFDPGRGIYVALCAVDGEEAPGPCSSGTGRATWISSDPPEWGAELAEPFGPDGSFATELELVARIDANTHCIETACAVTVRADDAAPGDRSLDLVLPVSFVEVDTAATESRSAGDAIDGSTERDGAGELAASTIADDGGGSPLMWTGLGVGVLLLGAGVATALIRRRRSVP